MEKSEITDESERKENSDMEKKLKEINYVMFNQAKPGPALPKVLEMKEMGENSRNGSDIRQSRLPTPRSNIKDERQLDSFFRRDNGKKSNRSGAPQREGALDRSYRHNNSRNVDDFEEDVYDDSEVTTRVLGPKSNRSGIREPMNGGSARRPRTNIYEDILKSTVSRYK